MLLHIYARWILLVFGHFLPGWLLWSPNSLSYCQLCISLSTSSPRSILRRCFSEDLSTGVPFSIRSTLMVCFCPQVATQALFMIELLSSLSSLLCPVYSMLLHPSPPCILYTLVAIPTYFLTGVLCCFFHIFVHYSFST